MHSVSLLPSPVNDGADEAPDGQPPAQAAAAAAPAASSPIAPADGGAMAEVIPLSAYRRSRGELLEHISMLHEAAEAYAGPGKLVVFAVHEDPAAGAKRVNAYHFKIGELDCMVATVRRLAAVPGCNVHMAPAVMRPDLEDGRKGSEEHVEAVLALVCDFDDDRAADYASRLPLEPDYAVETSAGRFQVGYLLDEPAPKDEAKAVAEALKRYAGCDHGTVDMSHVWRIPGTLNWPDKKKIAKGRPAAPQPARMAKAWDGTYTDLAALTKALEDRGVAIAPPAAKPAAGAGAGAAAVGIDVAGLMARVSPEVRELIVEGVPVGERSVTFFRVVCELREHGLDRDQIVAVIAAHPDGIAEKYAGRLAKEVERALDNRVRRAAAMGSDEEKTPQEVIEELNGRYAFVVDGDKPKVLDEAPDAKGRPSFRLLTMHAFQGFYVERQPS